MIVEYGTGKDLGLVRVTTIHYAKSVDQGKSGRTETCYKLAKWKWADPVQYTYADNAAYPPFEDALISAETEWDTHTSDELFTGPVEGAAIWSASTDTVNSVLYGDYSTDGVIAVTRTWYTPGRTRWAVESDILFDTDFDWGTTGESSEMDLQNIATHEIGHTLGLSDLYSSSCSAVTMYGYSKEGDVEKRTLEPSDITGLQLIYGL